MLTITDLDKKKTFYSGLMDIISSLRLANRQFIRFRVRGGDGIFKYVSYENLLKMNVGSGDILGNIGNIDIVFPKFEFDGGFDSRMSNDEITEHMIKVDDKNLMTLNLGRICFDLQINPNSDANVAYSSDVPVLNDEICEKLKKYFNSKFKIFEYIRNFFITYKKDKNQERDINSESLVADKFKQIRRGLYPFGDKGLGGHIYLSTKNKILQDGFGYVVGCSNKIDDNKLEQKFIDDVEAYNVLIQNFDNKLEQKFIEQKIIDNVPFFSRADKDCKYFISVPKEGFGILVDKTLFDESGNFIQDNKHEISTAGDQVKGIYDYFFSINYRNEKSMINNTDEDKFAELRIRDDNTDTLIRNHMNNRTAMKHKPVVFVYKDDYGVEHPFFIKRVKGFIDKKYVVIDEHKNRVTVKLKAPRSEEAEYSFERLSSIVLKASVQMCEQLNNNINMARQNLSNAITKKEELWTQKINNQKEIPNQNNINIIY